MNPNIRYFIVHPFKWIYVNIIFRFAPLKVKIYLATTHTAFILKKRKFYNRVFGDRSFKIVKVISDWEVFKDGCTEIKVRKVFFKYTRTKVPTFFFTTIQGCQCTDETALPLKQTNPLIILEWGKYIKRTNETIERINAGFKISQYKYKKYNHDHDNHDYNHIDKK